MASEYPPPGPGPGAHLLGGTAIGIFLTLQVLAAVGVIFAIFNTLPALPLSAAQAGANTAVDHEKSLLHVTALAGSLGGLLHGIRSLVWYVGNRDLRWSWIPTYITLPITGALISVVFYFVIRAGFVGLGGQGTPNYIGFAGAGALIGLFQAPAMLKLKNVFETLFTKPEPGSDARPQDATERRPGDGSAEAARQKLLDTPTGIAPSPVIVDASVRAKDGGFELTVEGSGFRPTSELYVDGAKVAVTANTPKQLVAVLQTKPASVRIVTPPPGGGQTAGVPVQSADA